MGCDRPNGLTRSLVELEHMKFPRNWSEELPPKETQDQLREKFTKVARERGLTTQQFEEALDFFEKYEERYYETPGGGCYHRACGGGAMQQIELGVYCANCGKLPDLLPPAFMQ